jgi:hypothetical protein
MLSRGDGLGGRSLGGSFSYFHGSGFFCLIRLEVFIVVLELFVGILVVAAFRRPVVGF